MFGTSARQRLILQANWKLTMRIPAAVSLFMALCANASADQNTAAPCSAGVSFGVCSVPWMCGSCGRTSAHRQALCRVSAGAENTEQHENRTYSPDEGGKLTTIVKSADGQVLETDVWYAENISGLWELSEYKVLGGATKQLTAGRYTLEFQADGTPFYRFAFAVATAPSDDPYQPPGTRYFIDGPWSEYEPLLPAQ